MQLNISKQEIHNLTKIQRTFDTDLIDLDYGFRAKIYPHISEQVLLKLKNEDENTYDNVIKAGILYSFVLDIPKIKVHISSYGINQFDEAKAKTAPWWDVRDLGLSWLKKADEYLAAALKKISQIDHLKSESPFFQRAFPLVFLWEMQNIININNSADVYMILSEAMQRSWEDFLSHFPDCTADVFLSNTYLKGLLISYLKLNALYNAMNSGQLLHITTGLVFQYEELPWQKSVVLSEPLLKSRSDYYNNEASYYLKRIWEYIDENPNQLPCYNNSKPQIKAKIIEKKSGLYL